MKEGAGSGFIIQKGVQGKSGGVGLEVAEVEVAGCPSDSQPTPSWAAGTRGKI